MSKITLDATWGATMNNFNEPVELCDANGKVIGHFLPGDAYRKLLYQLAESQCPYSAEQLQAMRQQTGGKPLTKVWESLGQP
jgi:hypothetical protein